MAPALGALWTQRGSLSFAWDVLRQGACSDCSLGASGMRATAPGTHLCGRRLDRLTRETAAAFSPGLLEDVKPLRGLSPRALRGLGRIPRPMLRRGGAGFAPIDWEDACNLAAARLRDERSGAAWALRVDPAGLDLETLFQLGRFAAWLERRREGPIPLVEMALPTEERLLREKARELLGHASSSTSSIELGPGDRTLVVSDGDQPLLRELIASLRSRGVLVTEAGPEDEWPLDVRHTLVFGRAGTTAGLAAGLPLPAGDDLEGITAAYFVGDLAARWCVGASQIPVRIHQASFLDPTMLETAPEAVLLLPASSNADLPGGGSHLSDDLVTRFSPEVHGAPASNARPHWEIPVRVAALADEDLGRQLASHDAAELRSALAAARPGLAGVLDLAAPQDSFRLPAPVA